MYDEKSLWSSIYPLSDGCLCGSWLDPTSQGSGGSPGACPDFFASFPLSLVMVSEDCTTNPHSVARVSEGHNTLNVKPE
jgi:hypothetical protein